MAVNMPMARKISNPITGLYNCTPENDMKPNDIRPMVMKVIPRPCRPSGTSL